MATATVTAADLRIVLTGPEFEPTGPAWDRATEAERRAYWRRLSEIAYFIKRQEIARGIGADGKKLPPVQPSSRPDGAKGQPLDPHYGESRTARLLAYSSTATGATLYWRAAGRKSWAVILGYHAHVGGEVRGAPLRDTIGISPRGRKQVAVQARQWWATGHEAAPVRPPRPAPAPLKPKPTPPPPTPAPARAPEAVPTGRPILPDRPIAERLTAWKEGADKVERLANIPQEIERLRVEENRIRQEYRVAEKKIKAKEWASKDPVALAKVARVLEIHEKLAGIKRERQKIEYDLGGKMAEILAIPEAERTKFREGNLQHIDRPGDQDLKTRAARARDRLRSIVRGEEVEFYWITPPSGQQRAFHYGNRFPDGRKYSEVEVPDLTSESVIAHEIAHALEWQVPGVHDAVLDFLAYRCGNETPVKMNDVPGSPGGYRDHERGRKDHFDRYFTGPSAWYVGSVYSHANSEVLTMGVEALFRDPAGFAAKDPEYCKFVLGLLSGELRRP